MQVVVTADVGADMAGVWIETKGSGASDSLCFRGDGEEGVACTS